MKTYDTETVGLQFDLGAQWVPADVAQELYNALKDSRRTIQALIGDGYMGYVGFRSRIDAALAAADGDEQ